MKDAKTWLNKQCPKKALFFGFTCEQCKRGFIEVFEICQMYKKECEK